ncbi:hypothetical protein CsSME_00027897 [Camellia sinensis var. sinensis]
MATKAGEGTSYGGGSSGGGGGGGKFRKRPFRRPQTTPYDRPQTALRNPSTNGWLSKLVDPASKLISASAHLFFSSVLRNRLPPPPPPPPQPPEANQESRDRFQEAILENAPGVQGPVVIDGGKPTSNFDCSGLSELEQILKKKTFTRSEIDHLTELLHSRTVDLPNWDEDKRNESIVPQPVSAFGGQDGFASSSLQENRIGSHLESHRFHGCISSPIVLEEDVAAPAELAKAYMGSRPSRVSPSMLGLRGQTLREDASLQNNVPFPPNSPVMSLVPKPVVRVAVSGNGFMTPRSRGRSAIYNMARTPYSRVHPTTTQKGSSSVYDDYGLPSASSSSQFTWEHARQYGPKQLALKRRSSVLQDDIGSVGPIRRLRQKTNLSTPKCLSLPVSGSPSNRGTGIGLDAARYPIASAQKLPSLGESNHRFLRTVRENEDTSMPGTNYTSVPSKSTEMATKILQQLEKLVPKEKSSEGKVAAGERSTSKLTPNMLSVQARRSLEYVDSSNILQNADDSHKLKNMSNTSLLDAHDAVSQKQDKVEENGPKRVIVSRHASTPAVISNATVSVKEAVPSVKTADSASTQLFTQSSQKKWGFQMSAHEDFLELDDEIFSNEAASTPLAEGKKKFETSVVESKAVSSEAVTVDKTPAVSEFKTLDGPILKKSTDLGTSDETVVGEKNTSFTFSVSPASGTNFQPVVASPQSTSAFDKIAPPKEPNAPPPLFSFSSKNVAKIPSHAFSSTSSVSESSGLISCSPLEPKPESSSSLANVAFGTTEVVPKTQDSDKVDNNKMRKYGDTMGKSEASISSALSTSTGSMFSFGSPANSSSLTNGSLESSPSIFSSPSPAVASSNFTNQTFTNSFTNVASSITATMSSNDTTMVTASNSSPSTSAAAPSFPGTPIFKFGSTFVAPSNSVPTASTTSNAETTDLKAKTEKETTFGAPTSSPFGGTSFSMASTGSSIFGSSVSANNFSQGSLFGTSSGSTVSTQMSPAETGVAAVTQSMHIQFGSSSSSPSFGTSGITSFTSGSSVFGSSTSSSSLFGSSTPSKVFGSSTSFGVSSSAPSTETNSVGAGGATSSLFASSWQPPKSSIFGSTFNTGSQSTGFSFGASSVSAAPTNTAPMVFGSSTAGASSGSLFSFTSNTATATASPSQAQSVFGTSVPVFASVSGNGDQMSMEDSMAEDNPIQLSTPTVPVPVFGQQPISTPSGFVFDSNALPSAGPFPFGGQQNQSNPQNPSPFQALGSLDFSAGGSSFSLGSGGGGDKSKRKIVKVKHKSRRMEKH